MKIASDGNKSLAWPLRMKRAQMCHSAWQVLTGRGSSARTSAATLGPIALWGVLCSSRSDESLKRTTNALATYTPTTSEVLTSLNTLSSQSTFQQATITQSVRRPYGLHTYMRRTWRSVSLMLLFISSTAAQTTKTLHWAIRDHHFQFACSKSLKGALCALVLPCRMM